MKKVNSILWGIVLIALGLIFGLNALGITDINIFFDGWWTLFIIIPSLITLIEGKSRIWSVIWLAIGIVLLLCARDILSFEIISKLIIPVILVIVGINLIFKDYFTKKVEEKIKAEVENDYCSTFSSQNVRYEDKEFKGANVDAVFGSVELNLENSIISSDQVINASSVFGGVEITMPENVNIKIKSTAIFGGVDNKAKRSFNENLPTIYVNGFCMFGGVIIK